MKEHYTEEQLEHFDALYSRLRKISYTSKVDKLVTLLSNPWTDSSRQEINTYEFLDASLNDELEASMTDEDETTKRLTRVAISLAILAHKTYLDKFNDLIFKYIHDPSTLKNSTDQTRFEFENMGAAQWHAFGQALKDAQLPSLYLGKNKLGNLELPAWQAFWQAIKFSQLQSLDLSDNDLLILDPELWDEFGQAIKDSTLQSLNLYHNRLGILSSKKWQRFCHALKVTRLQSLNLDSNQLEKIRLPEWQALGEAIKEAQLRSLVLSNNYLGLMHGQEWQDFWHVIKDLQLESLDLYGNDFERFKPEDWQTLFQEIKNSQLQVLGLGGNSLHILDSEQWKVFCLSIKDSQIKNLDVRNNGLGKKSDSDWQLFCQTIKDSHIESIDLYGNQLKSAQLQALVHTIKDSKLKSLTLSDYNLTTFGDTEWTAFLNEIDDNFNLQIKLLFVPQQIKSYIDRNAKLKEARQNAEEALTNPSPDDKALVDLVFAISLLNDKTTKNATELRKSLLTLRAKLAAHIFEHHYVTSLHKNSSEDELKKKPSQEEMRTSFLDALPYCLTADNMFVEFDEQNQKVFDKILIAAAGINFPFNDKLTEQQRLSLLQYTVLSQLNRIETAKPTTTSSTTSTLFSKEALPTIAALNDLKINKHWQELVLDKLPLVSGLKNRIDAISILALKLNEQKPTQL